MSVALVGTGARAKLIYESLLRNNQKVVGIVSSFQREDKHVISKRFKDVTLHDLDAAPAADSAIIVSKHGTNLKRLHLIDKKYNKIYVEKPLFLPSYEEISNLFYSDVFLLYNRRFYKTVQVIKTRCQSSQLKGLSVIYSEKTKDKQKRYSGLKQEDRSSVFFVHILDIIQYICGTPSLIWKSNKKSNYCGLADAVLEANGIEIVVRFADNIGTSSRIEGWLENSTYFQMCPLEMLKMWSDGGAINENSQRVYVSVQTDAVCETDQGIDLMTRAIGTQSDIFCTVDQEKHKMQLLKKWYYD